MLIFFFCTDTVWSSGQSGPGFVDEHPKYAGILAPWAISTVKYACMHGHGRGHGHGSEPWITTIWLTKDNAITSPAFKSDSAESYRITVAWCFEPALGSMVDSGCSLDMISVHTHNRSPIITRILESVHTLYCPLDSCPLHCLSVSIN